MFLPFMSFTSSITNICFPDVQTVIQSLSCLDTIPDINAWFGVSPPCNWAFLINNFPQLESYMNPKYYQVKVGDYDIDETEIHHPIGEQDIHFDLR